MDPLLRDRVHRRRPRHPGHRLHERLPPAMPLLPQPGTWHLKDGTRFSFERAKTALQALPRHCGHGWRADDIRRGTAGPMHFTKRLFAAAKGMGLHTALDTSGFSERGPTTNTFARSISSCSTSSPGTRKPIAGPPARTSARPWSSRSGWQHSGTGLGRFVLVPGLTDDPANVDGIARFVAPMRNVEWVEVLPFHQMGAFKWKAMGLDYELSEPIPLPGSVARVIGQFRDAGCRAR